MIDSDLIVQLRVKCICLKGKYNNATGVGASSNGDSYESKQLPPAKGYAIFAAPPDETSTNCHIKYESLPSIPNKSNPTCAISIYKRHLRLLNIV